MTTSSEQTRLETELLSRIAELESQISRAENLTVLGEMCAGMVHEISNPLTVIFAESHRLRLAVEQKDKHGDAVFSRIEQGLDGVEVAATRLRRLVRDVLTYSKRRPPAKRRYSIATAIHLALDVVRDELAESGIGTKVSLAKEDLTSEGDQDMIVQVFVNILNNAKEAIDSSQSKGRRLIKVTTKSRSESEVEISFSDNGTGMDRSTLDKIFDPFFTTKTTGQGTGLGLSIAHGIIKEHRGRIVCESELGRGTDLWIHLPK